MAKKATKKKAPRRAIGGQMGAAQLLVIFAELVQGAVQVGVIDADGSGFTAPTPQQDAELAAMAERVLKAHGVTVPAKVDAVIQMLPLILQMLG